MTSAVGSGGKGQKLADPVLAVSVAWAEAHRATADHCLRQQKLEAQFLEHNIRTREVAGRAQRGDSLRQAYESAQAAEALAAEQEQALLEQLAETPASSLAGIAAKLSVIVREAEDNTDLSDFPVSHVRSALNDLQRLMDQATYEHLPVSISGVSTDGCLESPSSLAAWCALHAWSQADEKRYRIWMTAFKALMDP